MSIAAMDKELKAAGCPRNANGDALPDKDGFTPVSSRMTEAPLPPSRPADLSAATRPTTDLGRYR